jgi:hypothetical protein
MTDVVATSYSSAVKGGTDYGLKVIDMTRQALRCRSEPVIVRLMGFSECVCAHARACICA